jgi:DNA topoisomerase-1
MNEEVGVKCPDCGGEILALKSKKGKRFYGCANYPACQFRSWNKPSGQKCPVCGEPLVEKNQRSMEGKLVCQNPQCKYVTEARS